MEWEKGRKIYLIVSTPSMKQNHCFILTIKGMGKGSKVEERTDDLTELLQETKESQLSRRFKRIVGEHLRAYLSLEAVNMSFFVRLPQRARNLTTFHSRQVTRFVMAVSVEQGEQILSLAAWAPEPELWAS